MTAILADSRTREEALDLSHNILVQAPAGSGKTGLLVQRMLACLARVERPEQVLAITFTNKAAAEMRVRVQQALQASHRAEPEDAYECTNWHLASAVLEQDLERGWNLITNPGRLRIQTIDSYNRQLADQAPLLSGLGGSSGGIERATAIFRHAILDLFDIIDDDDTPDQLKQAMQHLLTLADNRLDYLIRPLTDLLARREQWLGSMTAANDPDTAEWMDDLLYALVSERLAHAAQILPMALLNTLVSELNEAADPDKLPWLGAIHGWPRPEPELVAIWRNLIGLVLTSKQQYRKTLNANDGIPSGTQARKRAIECLKSLAGDEHAGQYLSVLSEVLDLPDPACSGYMTGLREDLMRVLQALVARLKVSFAELGQVDFTEVALRALYALQQGDSYTPLLERQDQMIRHLLIDEMQDTSQSQMELLRLLTAGWVEGDGRTLFMVGDPMQSIYGFRQANVRLFLQMQEQGRLEQLPLKCLYLSSNFRSDAGIVDWFNQTFETVFPASADTLKGVTRFESSSPVQAAESPAPVCLYPRIDDNGQAEAIDVAGVVNQLLLDGPQAHIAILVRARTHLRAILPALRHAGIAYRCQDIDPVQGSDAVNDVLALIRALSHHADVTAWAMLLRSPLVGLSWADMLALRKLQAEQSLISPLQAVYAAGHSNSLFSDEGRQRLSRFRRLFDHLQQDRIRYADLPSLVRVMWYRLGGALCCDSAQIRDVHALFRLLADHCEGGMLASRDDFEQAVADLYAQASGKGVEIMTIHKAKGLEFDHVLLVGLGNTAGRETRPLLAYEPLPDGLLLCARPPGNAAVEDQRLYDYINGLTRVRLKAEYSRLLYVGVTRAVRSLHLFASAGTGKDGEPAPAEGSFLKLMWPVISEQFIDQARPGQVKAEHDYIEPLSPRLPLEWQYPDHQTVYSPGKSKARATSMYSGLSAAANYATLVGEMYHAGMQRMVNQQAMSWDSEHDQAAMRAGFRRLGLPEPQISSAVDRVLVLLNRTLASDDGRWLLKPRTWQQAEYPVTGVIEGQVVNTRIDLCFEEVDELWIVDYKTTAEPVDSNRIEAYVESQKSEYAEQLSRYAALLSRLRNCRQVKQALFLPELGRLEVL